MKLDSPIEAIPGVGPASAKALRNHNIETVEDVLHTTPFRYTDFTKIIDIANTRVGQVAVVSGTVESCQIERTSRRRMILVWAQISDSSGNIDAVWFNQTFIANRLTKGSVIRLCGLVTLDKRRGKVLRNPSIQTDLDPRPEPHYSERTGIESGRFARIVKSVVGIADLILDPLPGELCDRYHTPQLSKAIRLIHFPHTMSEINESRSRLALDELWSLMVVSRLTKKEVAKDETVVLNVDEQIFKADEKRLPYKLTAGQRQALEDIFDDLQKQVPMRRLLNGDVGSGKTIVAFLASHQVIFNGFSVIFLAPTTVLAGQHYQNWRQLFPDVPHFLFTSGHCQVNGEEVSRSKAIAALKSTKAAFICGTHAVFHRDFDLDGRIGLVIVDEQHRFGVSQRSHLISSKSNFVPHLLSMSATPIPRTAALVLYGDLDISVLPEKPAERKEITTKLASEKSRPYVYQFVDQLISKGQQTYIVCPIIGLDKGEEESYDGRLMLLEERKAVVDEYERLQKTIFAHCRIGLLHGRMKQAEKDQILNDFRQGNYDILLSTSVVEVGVDVQKATAMLVEGAEYFGLAQLHQLRGRVGRGADQSFCFLFANNWSTNVKERLQLLEQYNDGFTLAEKDLALRGPGEIYGTLQAGFSPFKYASLADYSLIDKARQITEDIIKMGTEKWPPALIQWIDDRKINIHLE